MAEVPDTFKQRLAAQGHPSMRHAARGRRLEREADDTQREVDAYRRTQRWVDVRAQVLRREPLCRRCRSMGRVRAAEQVDHVVPLRFDPSRAYDLDNLQPLCVPCHAWKSGQERRGHTFTDDAPQGRERTGVRDADARCARGCADVDDDDPASPR